MSINQHSQSLASTRLYEQETSLELLALRHGIEPSSMIDFSLNVNPFGCAPGSIAAARLSLSQSNLYPDVNLAELRLALSNRHSQSQDRFFFGGGLDDVIKLLLQAWASDGDKILIHLPTFPRYALEAQLRGCEVIGAQGKVATLFDGESYERALQNNDIAVAFICTPNNPTGEIIPLDLIEYLVRTYPRTTFIVDEALINPVQKGAVGLLDRFDNVAILRTFSKFFGLAGMRVGYAIASKKLVEIANIGRPPFNVSLPAAAAAVAALQDEDFLRQCSKKFSEESAYFREQLTGHPSVRIVGHHGNMMLLELVADSSAEVASMLASQGIVVADATSFDGLQNTATLRISLKGREQNERLIAALLNIGHEAMADR
nr:histidinol-phosphate transaminase [uncultured Albidiferax sp.]